LPAVGGYVDIDVQATGAIARTNAARRRVVMTERITRRRITQGDRSKSLGSSAWRRETHSRKTSPAPQMNWGAGDANVEFGLRRSKAGT
jgi:hypothetical protein